MDQVVLRIEPALWLQATPVPDPESPLREGLTEADISPGVLGFLSIFVVAVAAIVLIRSLTSKLRGVSYRAAHEEALLEDAERERAHDAGEAAVPDTPDESQQDPGRPAG